MDVKDASGKILNDGDTVVIAKDLKLKGTSTVLKRGTKVKKIGNLHISLFTVS